MISCLSPDPNLKSGKSIFVIVVQIVFIIHWYSPQFDLYKEQFVYIYAYNIYDKAF